MEHNRVALFRGDLRLAQQGSSSSRKRSRKSSEDRRREIRQQVEANLEELFEKDDPLVETCRSEIDKMPTVAWLSFPDVLAALKLCLPDSDPTILVNAAACITRKKGGNLSILKQCRGLCQLPDTWRIGCYLGSGATSDVYLVVCEGSEFALKVPKRVHTSLWGDIKYLKELGDIDGIPRLSECINSMLVTEPVGEPFTLSNLARKGRDIELAGLLDVLRSAHSRNIVNRDIRCENIMIAKSLKTGKYRLFILDWGFAEKIDATNGDFCGSLETASDNVLQQYVLKKDYLTYTAADDLTSLVRCLFFFFNHEDAAKLDKLSSAAEILHVWEMKKDLFWQGAHIAAFNLEYQTLKSVVQQLQNSFCVV